jgi:hypothetical protein
MFYSQCVHTATHLASVFNPIKFYLIKDTGLRDPPTPIRKAGFFANRVIFTKLTIFGNTKQVIQDYDTVFDN